MINENRGRVHYYFRGKQESWWGGGGQMPDGDIRGEAESHGAVTWSEASKNGKKKKIC